MKSRLVIIILFVTTSCHDNYTPKPRAFCKINLPEKEYQKTNLDCPFEFEIPVYSRLINSSIDCFYNLEFSDFKGKLYLTYLPLDNNLQEHSEESRSLAYKHNVMAEAITEQVYINDSLKVYGMVYDFDGVTATSTQFYLTDSVNHFFRGALYFNTEITDSIGPVNIFVKYDIKKLVESFRWINH